MILKWFKGIETLEQLKQEYRKLAKRHHPDVGGSTADMKEINAEYDHLKTKLKNSRGKTESAETMDAFRDVIEAIINIPNIEIEVCGSWIWVSGNTRPHKDQIKAAGYRWAAKKKMWYWCPPEQRTRRKPRTSTPMEVIREKYGSERIRKGESEFKKLAMAQ